MNQAKRLPTGRAERPASYNVLLVGKDPEQTELYGDLIREVADCDVDVIHEPGTGFEWLARSSYSLVVIDEGREQGAHLDGLAVLEQVKRISPVTSVILIAEDATVESAVAAIRMGAEDYLKKPLNLDSFKLAIKRGLGRKAVFAENKGASSFLNLLNSCQMISASLEIKRIFEIIQSYLSRELGSSYTAVYTLQDSEPVRVDELRPGQDPAMEEVLDIALRATNPLPGMRDTHEFYRFVERGTLTPGFFVFRFQCAGPSDFFCICLSPQRPANLDAFEGRLRMVEAQIELTGKNIEEFRGVKTLVYVDDATGLYNTRYLNYILDREIGQAEAARKAFAVLFIDADRFKSVNDTHGHLVGTKLLHELGHHLKKFLRERDTVFRYGGDEFVAVLSPSDLAAAKMVAERIRSSVEKHVFLAKEGLNLHFTVSIGVALFPDHANSKKEIIEAADHAMYDAKKSTRNSVSIAGERREKDGTRG